MKLIKQTVYLPVKDGDSEISVSYWERDTHIVDVKEESGYFFTLDQLNEYTQNVIKQALETAAEKADACIDMNEDAYVEGSIWPEVDKQSKKTP